METRAKNTAATKRAALRRDLRDAKREQEVVLLNNTCEHRCWTQALILFPASKSYGWTVRAKRHTNTRHRWKNVGVAKTLLRALRKAGHDKATPGHADVAPGCKESPTVNQPKKCPGTPQ